MAYYTSRVDNDGNELERRQTVRSTDQSMNATTCNSSTFLPQLSDRSASNKSSVRYINPAAFIETANEDCNESVYSEATTMKSSSSCLVPSLDLRSEDNMSTQREYLKDCPKVSAHSDAYETWLSAKNKLLALESARRREMEEKIQREKEERQKLANQKFEEWMQQKQLQEQAQQQLKLYEEQEKANKGLGTYQTRAQISAEEASLKVKEWTKRKLLAEKQRREMAREEEERRKQWEEQRQHMAVEAWNAWLQESDSKPKPVPLNRGIFTLRGTISDIYVNPNEWQSLSTETQ